MFRFVCERNYQPAFIIIRIELIFAVLRPKHVLFEAKSNAHGAPFQGITKERHAMLACHPKQQNNCTTFYIQKEVHSQLMYNLSAFVYLFASAKDGL